MTGGERQRHRRIRARRFRRNREQYLPWLILVAVIVCAAVLAVILGNILGRVTDEIPLCDPDIPEVSAEGGRTPVPTLRADAFAFGYAVTGMVDNGTTAVSVLLRDGNDVLTYRSEAAVYMKRQGDGTVTVSAPEEIAYLHENGVYVCGIFQVLSTNMAEPIRSAEEYYENSLVSELAKAGIDAILFDGLSFDADSLSASLAYLSAMQRVAPETAVGVVLSPDAFTEDNAEIRLRSYLGACDFFVMDLRGITDTSVLTQTLNACVYCIRAFPVRLFINRDDADIKAWLAENGYAGLQVMP